MADEAIKLRTLLEAVFEDGVVEVDERKALNELRRSTGWTAAELTAAFGAFLEQKWGEAIADGRLTVPERSLLHTIIRELDIPEDALPLQAKLALRDD